MKQFFLFFFAAAIFISCRNKSKNENGPLPELGTMISPAGDSAAEPFLFTDKNGLLYMSWMEKKDGESQLKYASLENEHWSEPVLIARGNNWFVNWADYPVFCSDGNKNRIAHFLEKSDVEKFTYDVKLVTSADDGRSWNNVKMLHDDGKKAEHGFVSIKSFGDNYFISWLDGRKTAVEGNQEGHEGHHGEMTLRGAIIKSDGTKIKEWELDDRTCDCCQTSVAITGNGPIVVYRDRSGDETRDISIVRFVNNEWTKPAIIFSDNWSIAGCPVNGPRSDVLGNNLAIAWFSMPSKKGEVKVVFSKDGGASFARPVRVDEGRAIGRVDVVMLDNTTAMVCWMEGSSVKAAKVHADGTKEKSIFIATSSQSRSAGFPQVSRSGNNLVFAWTDADLQTIKTIALPLEN